MVPDPYKIGLDLFGSAETVGLLLVSDLHVAQHAAEETRHSVSVERQSGTVVPQTLREDRILRGAMLRGTISLANGANPAVLAHYYLSLALPELRFGASTSRGYGSVESCHMLRAHSDRQPLLNPIEKIFRKAGHEIIKQVVTRPDLIYSVEWRDLARIIALAFEEIGYQVKLTQASQDGGKDIALYCVSGREAGSRHTHEYYVELKHWRQGAKVGSGAIQKLVEVSIRDAVTGAVFISTSGYADPVKKTSFGGRAPILGDLSTIRSLCQFYVASRANRVFITKSLEELLNVNWQDEPEH